MLLLPQALLSRPTVPPWLWCGEKTFTMLCFWKVYVYWQPGKTGALA